MGWLADVGKRRICFIYVILYILAWEPSVAKGTHSYSRRLPALGRKLRFPLMFNIDEDAIKEKGIFKQNVEMLKKYW